MRRRRPHARRSAPFLAALLALAACAPAGSGGGSASPGGGTVPDVGGAWDGTVEIGGSRIAARLVLAQSGRTLEGTVDAVSLGLSARGPGSIDGSGEVRLELRYGGDCPGTVELRGHLASSRLAGDLAARDCTGPSGGTFTFQRP